MSGTRNVRLATLLAAAGVALAIALPAHRVDAAAIAVYDGTEPSAGGHTWTYRVSLPQSVRVAPGDFLTIFDFGGFTGVQSAPANWTYVGALEGPVPVLIAVPADDPAKTNLSWRYDGTSPIIGTAQDLGDFRAESTASLPVDSWFASESTRNDGGLLDGTPISNLAIIPVPLAPELGIPEPGTIGLLAVGSVMALRRRR
jgi:hypothetical protein